MTEKLLDVKNLNTWFCTQDSTVKAVRNVNFSLNKREILGIVGESGCGKSVTVKSIMGLVDKPGRIVSGEIIYSCKNLLELNENEMRRLRGKEIAYLMQNPMSAFNPVHNIRKHITDTILIHEKIKKKEALKKTINLLNKMGIVDSEKTSKKYPHQFSGGMLQRAAIAMAISCNPKLLIADEPTTSLDVSIESQILSQLKELRDNLDMSIIIITHNFGIVWDICDKVNVMYAGSIVESASVKNIYDKPLHPYTRALLSSIVTMEMDKESMLPTPRGNVIDMRDVKDGCDFAPRCDFATDYCINNTPKPVEIEKEHYVQCHYAGKGIW